MSKLEKDKRQLKHTKNTTIGNKGGKHNQLETIHKPTRNVHKTAK